MQTCRQCKKLFRADHVGDMLKESDWVQSIAETFELTNFDDLLAFNSAKALNWAQRKGKKLAPGLALVRNPEVTMSWLAEDIGAVPGARIKLAALLSYMATEQKAKTGLQIPCPNCGGDLTEPRQFNLMFESRVGAVEADDDSGKVYLRPETAQGIFLQYKNVLDTTRVRAAFRHRAGRQGVPQRSHAAQFHFPHARVRADGNGIFLPPEEGIKWYEFWVAERLRWWEAQGMKKANLFRHEIRRRRTRVLFGGDIRHRI